ncbi:MAG: Gfo/Idh/MocA family protein [Candidatus Methylacidiphilales bacterium]|nr:Gfo/Idh/MocA family oxidoreductase [Candidatus Methylacidiphilales bacterium]
MKSKLNVGVIGCGNIAPAYFKGCKPFSSVEVIACADIDVERAKARAAEFEIRKAYSVDELLSDPEVDIVVNLTVPQSHASINIRALQAGKHAYCEKPFALETAEGQEVIKLAEEKGLRVGCAPDTFLGGGIQTCRKIIEDGIIGEPVGAVAFMMSRGPEGWHPNPEFFYHKGGGPMLDMGPYYLTALVNCLGPVKRTSAITRTSFAQRVIGSEAKKGQIINVEITTHLTGALEFVSGPIATVGMSFDVHTHNLPRLEIYGSKGSLSMPDPNNFDGEVKVKLAGEEWKEVPHSHSIEVRRGIGVADMAQAIIEGRPHRASGALAQHVLEVMLSFDKSSKTGTSVEIESKCDQPQMLKAGQGQGQVD